jgi:cell wall assembly regulator SMI1
MQPDKESAVTSDLWKEGEQRNPPCSEELILLVEERVGCPLPEDYRQFMLAGNGQPDTVEPRIRFVHWVRRAHLFICT